MEIVRRINSSEAIKSPKSNEADKIALLTFTTSSVEFSRLESYLPFCPNFTFKAAVTSTRNGFTSNDEGGMKLAQELNKEPISIEVNLRYFGPLHGKLPTPHLYQLRLFLASEKSNVLQKLWELFGSEIKFSAYLEPIIKGLNAKGNLISSKGMTIKPESYPKVSSKLVPFLAVFDNTTSGSYECSSELPFFAFLPQFINVIPQWVLKIEIHVPDSIAFATCVDVVPTATDSQSDEAKTLKILEEERYTDVIILAGNGAKIKAHKVYLSVGSPVLEATFKNKMKESATGTLDMKDMTEKGVRAFLRYLYGKDLTAPKEDIEVAFDLLLAGNKYQVLKLEALMATHLEATDEADFGVELAYRMYTFVRVWNPNSALKKKAIRILKFKWAELVTTEEYQELFKDGPNSESAKAFLEDIVNSQIDVCDYPQEKTEPVLNENPWEKSVQVEQKEVELDLDCKKEPSLKNEPLDKLTAPVGAGKNGKKKKKDKMGEKVRCYIQ